MVSNWIMRIVVAALTVFTAAGAQTAQFEVASIKPSPPPEGMFVRTTFNGGPGTPDPGTFRCENCSLTMLIMRAYDLKDYQFSGPGWADSTRFNISAKIALGTTKEQFQEMQQSFLADRFKFTFHREKKELAVYELVVVRAGPKFKESAKAAPPADDGPPPLPPGPPKTDAGGFPVLPPGRGPLMMVLANGHATMRSAEESMAEFAGRLADQVRRPIADQTGLKGKYDFTLNWVIEGPGYSTDEPGPTIFQALQDQLGLKLESKKGMVDMLVVDHVEKTPTEN
jgi:uncharacterized protein (TIGR03435 family)